MPADAPRLLIADDDYLVRAVLSKTLGDEFDVIGTAETADEAIDAAAAASPDVVVVDVQMPGGGESAARGIAECCPDAAIVALSADDSRAGVLGMLDAGAITYVRKDVATEELITRLHVAIAAHARTRPH